MFKLNLGYGLSKTNYATEKGARIAASRFMNNAGVQWTTIYEINQTGVVNSYIYFSKASLKLLGI